MRDKLLAFGPPCESEEKWVDYSVLGEIDENLLATFAFGQSEELPIRQHAWRALAAYQATSRYDQFVTLLIDESYQLEDAVFTEDFLYVVQLLGKEIIPNLTKTLSEREPLGNFDIALILALQSFAQEDEQKANIIEILSNELSRYMPTYLANAQLVQSLVDLKAVSKIDIIREAFTKDIVNQGLCGCLAELEEELGVEVTDTADDETVNLIAKYQYLERKVVLGELSPEADVYERTNYFLELYGNEATCELASSVEGVLAMALLMEQLVPLEELLSVIWSAKPDGGLPIWQSIEEENAFLDDLLDIQTSVSKQMSKQKYFPTRDLRDPDSPAPTTAKEELVNMSFRAWAFGVLRGFAQFLPEGKQKESPWLEFEQQMVQLLIHELDGRVPEEAEDHPIISAVGELMSLRLASQVGAIDALAHHQPVKAEKLPGRNEPCPCGSGKKYKKCCGV